MRLPRLPDGLSWVGLAAIVACLLACVQVATEVAERRRVIGLLEQNAHEHPENAPVAAVIASCNKRVFVDLTKCSQDLVNAFGNDVLARIAVMQEQGAFGRPLPTDSGARQ